MGARFDYPDSYRLENYSIIFSFEQEFDSKRSTLWMQENWMHSITLSIVYIIVIFGGQKLLENRKPFKLQNALTLWNMALAIFSIFGLIRMTPEMVWALKTRGFEYSMCAASFAQGVTGFWTQMFAMSKVFEFGDTAFIILRKRPLIFLHWYHHISVLMYTWHAYKDHTASGRWYIWMNYAVHAFMYSYYALRSFNLRLPKRIAMVVTTLQIVQMIMGIAIALKAYRIKALGGLCQQTFENLYLSFFIYFTYFLLFCNFFYNAYVRKGDHYAKRKDESVDAHWNRSSKGDANGIVKRRPIKTH